LNPDVIAWTEQTLGVPVYDHYGQTEHAMMVINHHAPALRQPMRPGSMGIEMRGFHAVIVDDEGHELGPGEEGQVGLDIAQSPLYWFRGYYKAREWSDKRIIGGRYYLTGDAASRDADNFFYFTGRTDDIISSGGYRIGPFEVENALMQHAAVAEVAVVGKPDELRGEVVTAFVVLKAGHTASEELGADLSQFVKANLSAHAYPRAVTFVDQLPKTPSGKVQRFLCGNRREEHPARPLGLGLYRPADQIKGPCCPAQRHLRWSPSISTLVSTVPGYTAELPFRLWDPCGDRCRTVNLWGFCGAPGRTQMAWPSHRPDSHRAVDGPSTR
jgi:acyl-coenzyme A synthetase/AMP-(fatty) acid ligase